MEQWLTNYQFSVSINGGSYGFAKVSNIAQELEYDSIQEGGRNWSPVFFRKPRTKHDVLTLEKGVKAEKPNSKARLIQTGDVLRDVIITVGGGEEPYLKYTFDEGIVTKIELGGLDAKGQEILIRKIEIAHTGLERVALS